MPTFFYFKRIKKTGEIKVAIDGVGGDEIILGMQILTNY